MDYIAPLNGDPSDPDRAYVDGNPALGIEGSIPPAAAIEHPMREILEVITGLGDLAPDPGDLTQLRQAIEIAIAAAAPTIGAGGDLPLGALPPPEIVSSDHRLAVTPAAAIGGGTLSVGAGTWVVVGAEGETSGLGRLVALQTPAYVSADLAVAATYYLRGRVEAGALVLYVQQGSDGDPVPGSLTGTPDAVAGGGFDSTPIDILIARVETGTAGTTPTVTPLANAAVLRAVLDVEGAAAHSPGWSPLASGGVLWGRTPTAAVALSGVRTTDVGSDWTLVTIAHRLEKVRVRAASVDRYQWQVDYMLEEDTSTDGRVSAALSLEA